MTTSLRKGKERQGKVGFKWKATENVRKGNSIFKLHGIRTVDIGKGTLVFRARIGKID